MSAVAREVGSPSGEVVGSPSGVVGSTSGEVRSPSAGDVGSPTGAAGEVGPPSVESEVFHGQFKAILESVQSNLVRTCEKLLSDKFIDVSEHTQFSDDSKNEDERAHQLLRTVGKRIREDSTRFYDFLKVLDTLHLSDLASQLKRYKGQLKLLVDNRLFLVGVFESRISDVPGKLLDKKLVEIETAQLCQDNRKMSPTDKATALADDVLKIVNGNISKFTILMECLSELFGLAQNWPIHESSPGSFFTFLAGTVKKMEEDISDKDSTIQRVKEAQDNLERVVDDLSSILGISGVLEKEIQAGPESLEAIEVETLKQELDESQKKIETLEKEKRKLQEVIKKLESCGNNAELIAQKNAELRELERELKEERQKYMEKVMELSKAQKKMREGDLETKKNLKKEVADLKLELDKKNNFIQTGMEGYLRTITNLQEEVQRLIVRL